MPEGALLEADIITNVPHQRRPEVIAERVTEATPETVAPNISFEELYVFEAAEPAPAPEPSPRPQSREAILRRIRDIGWSGYEMRDVVRNYFENRTSLLTDSVRYVQDGQYRIEEYHGPIGEALDVYFRFFPHPNGCRPGSRGLDLDCGAKVVLARPDAEYLSRLREAVTFLRRNSSRRYSDSTIGSLMRKLDVCEEQVASTDGRSLYFAPDYRMPTLIIIEDEPGYDEETEVKTGGIIGVALITPSLDESPAKLLMAVKEARRREGIGSKLMDGFRRVMPTYNTVTYLSNTNTVGMLFAVDAGFVPTELTPNGVMQLRYEEGRRRAERE